MVPRQIVRHLIIVFICIAMLFLCSVTFETGEYKPHKSASIVPELIEIQRNEEILTNNTLRHRGEDHPLERCWMSAIKPPRAFLLSLTPTAVLPCLSTREPMGFGSSTTEKD